MIVELVIFLLAFLTGALSMWLIFQIAYRVGMIEFHGIKE